jgi:hypothetical protein
MANIAKLTPGGQSAYTSCGFTASDFNSLLNGYVVVASSEISNATNLDLMAEVSFSVVVGGTTGGGSYLALWILPKNRDNSTYGDGVANGATLPGASYAVASCSIKPGVTSGNTVVGTFPRFFLPRGAFKFAVSNHCGVALNAAASAVFEYRTINIDLNG